MQIVVVAHNIRSTHNIGSIFRTCDGFGVTKLFLTGYSPYPTQTGDVRLPHESRKITQQIHKTALGAEMHVPHQQRADVLALLDDLKGAGYTIVALEQAPGATLLHKFTPQNKKIALVLGEEVHGMTPDLLAACNHIVEIPMHGKKESFNVSVATGIALYALCALH